MWILPTRSRPQNLQRAIENYPDAPITVVFTEGDPLEEEYGKLKIPPDWDVFLAAKDSTVPSLMNQVYMAHKKEPCYGFIGDDVIPPEGEWWKELDEAAGDWFVAYPTDSIWGNRGCPHFCIGGELVRHMDFFAAPWFHHNFIDQIWWVLALKGDLGRHVDIPFRHLHPLDSSAPMDSIHALGQSQMEKDKELFDLWRNTGQPDFAIKNIKDAMRCSLR
jgi:hypothetical protein